MNYVVSNQNKDGSWYYAEGNKGKWIDNYHTGYILDCMKDYKIYSGNTDYDIQYQKGLDYYLNNFITVEGIPKFYHNSVFPVDCTSAAQTILTLCKNNRIELAVKVAHTMIDNMQTDQGSFYFRSTGKKINKNSFMRWSNAWMFYSLSQLSHILKSEKLNIDY